jgi:hypothetical protein
MPQAPLALRRWKRAEYQHLVGLGVSEGEPIGLIGGQLVVAEPKSAYHCSALSAAEYALRAVLPPAWIVRTQAPLSLVNLVDRVLEIYRDPAPGPSAPYGWRYRSVTTLTPPAVVAPLAFTSSRIAVADLPP